MPAWGVRTALTALRTFMAEAGTAGQVGGLEAPADVRKRLAKESRQWKCGMGCGGKSNLEIMRDWWQVCREKGVKVDEEGVGEGTRMEVLPEEVNLEARSKDEKEKEQQQQQPIQSQTPPLPAISEPSADSIRQASAPTQQVTTESSKLQPSTSTPVRHAATPTPESAQSHAESYLSTSELNEAVAHRRPMMSVHAPPMAAANAAVNDPAPLQTTQAHNNERDSPLTLTIDRAIAGVFLMLILMLLKKIFYPAGTTDAGSLGYVDGNGGRGFYMERDM